MKALARRAFGVKLAAVLGLAALGCGSTQPTDGSEATARTSAKLSAGLVAAYAFDENGGSAVIDATGHGHDTTLSGQTRVSGKYGRALAFDDNFLTVADADDLDLTTSLTISAWVLPAVGPPSWSTVAFKEGGVEGGAYFLYEDTESGLPALYVAPESGGTRQTYAGRSLTSGAWNHLATTYDGAVLKLYLNGVLFDSATLDAPLVTTGGPLTIGGNNVWGEYFHGRLDELRIYNRALSAEEIAADRATPLTPGAATDTTPPSVTLTAPSAGTVSGGVVTLHAEATDLDGTGRVEFLIDGIPLGASDFTPPYERQWFVGAATPGPHSLQARAYDASGNSALSNSVAMNVDGPTRPGLLAAFGFDEGSGDVAFDATGAGHDTPLSGQERAVGKFGGSLAFHDSPLTVANAAGFLDLSSALTISAWVLPTTSVSERQPVLAKESNNRWFYGLSARIGFGGPPRGSVLALDGMTDLDGTAPLVESAWSHLTLTFDGSTAKLYTNGVLVRSAAVSSPLDVAATPLTIGGSTALYSAFDGYIDEVRIYDRALTQSEIDADLVTPINAGAAMDTTPPTVALTAPSAGPVSGMVTLSAEAADSSGLGVAVTFLLDGNPIGTSLASPPYTKSWFTRAATAGDHTLRARASDAAGNSTLSAPVTVHIDASNSVPGLVAAYGFDEESGETIVDAALAGHDAVLSGQQRVVGRFGKALEFSDASIVIADTELLDLTTEMTLSAWVLPSFGSTGAAPIILKDSSWSPLYGLHAATGWPGGPEGGVVVDDNWRTANTFDRLSTAHWSYVASTYDGSEIKLYVNGQVIAANPASGVIATSDRPLELGGYSLWSSFFRGRLDEVRIYNRALSAAELDADALRPVNAGAAADTTAPSVSLTAPLSGPAKDLVTLAAEASDAGGAVSVQFLVDGVALGAPVLAPPYSKTWHAASAAVGAHTLQARAIDSSGNTNLSNSVTMTVAAADTIPGLVAAFGFDEASGDTVVDAARGGHDTTLNGQTRTLGKFGGALAFEDSVITIPASEAFELNTLTLSAWVLQTPPTGDWRPVLVQSADWDPAYSLAAETGWPGGPNGSILADYSYRAESYDKLPITAWHHLATTYDGSMLRFYIGGELVASTEVNVPLRPAPGFPVEIGGYSRWGFFFSGRIDELRIYSRALTQAEIALDRDKPINAGAAPDTTPPTVSLTAPAAGQVSGMVTLEAEASDDGGPVGVEFLVDGNIVGSRVFAPPLRQPWFAGAAGPGTHSIRARAIDAAGNVTLSGTTTVTIAPGTSKPGLVAAFSFDESDGDTLIDQTGAGHDTVLSGQTRVAGKYGGGLEFSGSFLTIPNPAGLLDLTTGLTLSAWVQPNTVDAKWRPIFAKEGDRVPYILYATDDAARPAMWVSSVSGSWNAVYRGTPIPEATWTHLAATYDGTEVALYVDGEKADSTSADPLAVSNGPLRIGGNQTSGYSFSGKIDELRVYNRALTAAEIEADRLTPVTQGSATDTTPPIVTVTAPAAGSTVSGSVQLEATATDTSGIRNVRFFVDNQLVGDSVFNPPYRVLWLAEPVGAHTIRAEATDHAGNTGSSAAIAVTADATSGCNPTTVSDNNPCTTDSCSGNVPVFTPVNVGVSCSNGNRCDGVESCDGSGHCLAGTPPTRDATCDNVDDDCDGQVDEDFVSTTTQCGVGACVRTGASRCEHGAVVSGCAPGTPIATSDASCDGVDQDCDGSTDEDYVGAPTQCGVGACAATGVSHCANGTETSDCSPRAAAANDSSCNGIDDDCDGQTDEDYVAASVQCGVGACRASAPTSCQNGAVVSNCVPRPPAATDATCNGVDDDCDGQTDEDYRPVVTSCGLGVCASSGTSQCQAGHLVDTCTAGTPTSGDSNCNGVDDDCDGQIDEDFVAVATSCGVGACASTGTAHCQAGHLVDSCAPHAAAPVDSSCNGVDDDCDGQTDEDYIAPSTSCGLGACAATGHSRCVAGHVSDDCQPGSPAANDATCNGVDDDCDGQIDENYVPVPTTCGAGACSATGTTRCEGGQVRNSCTAGGSASSDSVCNGIDDDCDGQTDEDFTAQPLTCGVGACAAQGTSACESGAVVNHCTPLAAAPNDATCNGIDDDCNGQIDEDFVATGISCGAGACRRNGTRSCENGTLRDTCTPGTPAANDTSCNGIDDDCDGQIDEDFVAVTTSCGQGACQRNGSRTCQNGQLIDSCAAGAPAANDASCNGIDEDCNGQVDEDFVATSTQCGVGACRASGSTSCQAGRVVDSCVAGSAAASDTTCNGIDDDCDGTSDEDYAPTTSQCGVGACRVSGTTRCQAGSVLDDCTPGVPAASDATCNGSDEDCDGVPDDDFTPASTSCGVGACRRTGTSRCNAGQPEDTCRPGTPAATDASCNGIDDDCNGSVDEDFLPSVVNCGVGACAAQGSTVCVNAQVTSVCHAGAPTGTDNDCDGIDDDCDGTPDDAFVASCSGSRIQRCVSGVLRNIECSDGNACNGAEGCAAATCTAGSPPNLDDGNACTLDVCDPSSGVSHPFTLRGVSCGSSRACDGQGTCASLPTITTQPESVTVNVGEPLSFAVNASGSGLSYQWKRFGAPIAGATSATYSLAHADANEDGAEFSVVVSNAAGSVASAVAVVHLTDSSGPSLTIDGESTRSVDSDIVTITGNVQDAGSGVATVSLQSSRLAAPLAVVVSAGTGVFSVEVPLRVGANVLTVTARDRQNNQTQRSVTISSQVSGLPQLSITSPVAGSAQNVDSIDVSGVVRASVPPDQIRLALGGAVTFPTGSDSQYTFVFHDVHLTSGINVLTVSATTTQGTVSAQVLVTRDGGSTANSGGPVIRVTGAQDVLYVNAATHTVSGTVDGEPCVASVSVNGLAARVTGAGRAVTFDSSVNLASTNTPIPVLVAARDCAGRTSELKYTVIRDTSAPLIEIALSPAPSVHAVSVTPYIITGSVTEANLAGLSANQQSIGVLPGSAGRWDFSFSVPIVRGSDQPVSIEAWDGAGNRSAYSLLLRFEAASDIELLAPSSGSELLSSTPSTSVPVTARVQGAQASWVLAARVDGGNSQLLSGSSGTYRGSVAVSGFGAHTLTLELLDGAGSKLAATQTSFSVKDLSSVPLQITLREPLSGATNLESNQVVVLGFNRPMDANLLRVELFETVHGKTYRQPASGAGMSEFTAVQLVDVNRDDTPVPGGISFLPGDQLVAFYPAREFGYGATVALKVTYDGQEALRGKFQIRALPTLISGFVADQFFNPIEGLEVTLDDGHVTKTNNEGAFSFGFGSFADGIAAGRRRMLVNPGMKDTRYGSVEHFVYTESGRAKDMGVVRTQLLSAAEPFRHVSSHASNVALLEGRVVLDLSQAQLTFPSGSPDGDVHSELLIATQVAYPARAIAPPLFTYGFQPIGIEVSGNIAVDLALPEETAGKYIDGLPARVVLLGVDPAALQLVPVGVGIVDKSAHRVRSEGALLPGRLDFIGVAPLRDPAIQELLLRYGHGELTLTDLVARLEAGR